MRKPRISCDVRVGQLKRFVVDTVSQIDGAPMEDENECDRREQNVDSPEPTKTLNAEDLFGDRREIWIELHGVRYRLRITRRNKLILQK